jgi:DNA-binding transcriptional MerR regulator
MGKYSIKDLEKVSGIKAHTIRIWEQRYALVTPERTDTNIRLYSDDDLKKILSISILNKNGWKISRIADLDMNEIQKNILLISKDSKDPESNIDNLIMAMIDLDDSKFTKILDNHISRNGIENTFTELISKLLSKAGYLWLAGTINPSHEHFVSNIIRQKLIASINSVKANKIKDSKKFMLFLPEGEWHELGLLYTAYLVKKRGHKSLYLGQNTPLEAAGSAAIHWNPDFVVFSILTDMDKAPIHQIHESITKLFHPIPVISNFPYFSHEINNLKCNHHCIKNYTEFENTFLQNS